MVLQTATFLSFFTSGILSYKPSSYAQMMAATTNISAAIMWCVAIGGVQRSKGEIEW